MEKRFVIDLMRVCTRSSRVDYRFSIKTTDSSLSLSVASPRLEIEKLLSLVFLGLRYASDTLLWIEGKKKRGEPRERAGARVSFRVPASVSVPNPRRDSTVADFIPNPNLFYTKYLIRYDDESDTGTEQIVFFSKIFIRLFVNIDYYYCFIFTFPDFNPLFPIGKFHVFMGANVRYFMENMYNIPNNYKMQQIIFSNKILLFISFLSGLLTVCIYTFFNSL